MNNAGVALSGNFIDQATDDVAALVALNCLALIRLAHVAAQTFAAAGAGAIINIGSVVGLVPEFNQAAYAASKSFVQTLSQAMSLELAPRGVYMQGVLPAGTKTEIWARSGADLGTLPNLMEVGDLVDAALVGFDRREVITIPLLHDAANLCVPCSRFICKSHHRRTAPLLNPDHYVSCMMCQRHDGLPRRLMVAPDPVPSEHRS